ncbi:MAG TPA: GAF domain-containing protein [Anaerolineae bacterium]|nr:GAF domain-containing protein [Anaerolineae bacterium]
MKASLCPSQVGLAGMYNPMPDTSIQADNPDRGSALSAEWADRIATINRVSHLITASLSMDELLETAIEALNTYLHYSNIALLLIAADQPEVLVLRARSGLYSTAVVGEYRQSIDQGLIGRAVRTCQQVIVNDVQADPAYIPIPGAPTIRAEIATPIRIGERVLGALNIENDQLFTRDDAVSLEIIADQLAIAIENARLFAHMQSNVEQLSRLYALSERISVTRDPDEVMRAALEEVATHSPYRCSLALFESEGGERPTYFHVLYVFQPGVGVQHIDDRFPFTDDPLNPLLDSGQTVAIIDVATDPRVPDFLRREQIESGRPALALIPLIVGGRRIGNLVLSHFEPHPWTDDELRLFRSSANQVAAAIENAQRFEREKQRTERLGLIARVSQRIAARLDPHELFTTTVEELHHRLGYDHVSLFLLDPIDATVLVQRARASRWPRGESGGYRQSIGQGIIGAAACQRAPQLVNEVTADPRYVAVPNAAELRAELALPILLGDRLLGVLDLASARNFREGDVSGMSIVADQLAIALEHVTLFERAQEVGVLEERQRLARDLHDSVTQLIFSLMLIAQSIAPAYQRDPAEGERRINRVLELSRTALAEMRALLFELRPPDAHLALPKSAPGEPTGIVPGLTRVQRDGLTAALQQHVADLARDGLEIKVDARHYAPPGGRFPLSHEEALYRIAQEALNNVVKHARAQHVWIKLMAVNSALHLTVQDDGVGFEASGAALRRVTADNSSGGFGLKTMRERAEVLGGQLAVTSQLNAGTTIEVTLPVGEEGS